MGKCERRLLALTLVVVFQDNLQTFVPSLGGQIGGQMINVGGHFLSKEAGHLNFVGLHPGGGPPVPPPKPGSKGAGAKEAGAGEAGGAGGQGGGNLEKTGKGEGGDEGSSLKVDAKMLDLFSWFRSSAVYFRLLFWSHVCPTMDVILAGGERDGKNTYPHVKTYVSPWEKAMKGDKELIATLKGSMPGPVSKKDIPDWKSFNRFFI